MPRPRGALAGVLLLAGVSVSLQAQDWPQMLGPTRNGVYDGVPLRTSWPSAGPPVVWRKSVGQGFSGPVVTGDRVILFHRVGNREVVEALDARTGTTAWRYEYPTAYRDDFGFDEGPRAVPVVADGVVYAFGAEGQLHAVDLVTGRRLWSEDTMARFAVPKGFFGAAGSPIVEGGRVIADVGGRGAGIVAFDAKTGRVLWQATDDGASYSSGVMATIAGQRRAIVLTREGLVGLDPASGRLVFSERWRSRSASSVNAASPLVVGDLLFVSAEYGPGAGAFRMSAAGLAALWASNDVLSTHYATGKVRWNVDQFRAGSVTLALDRLVIMKESGELVLADATPAASSTCATTPRSSAWICDPSIERRGSARARRTRPVPAGSSDHCDSQTPARHPRPQPR